MDERARRVPQGVDEELSTNQFRKDKSNNEGRSHITLKGQKKTALGSVCTRVYGDASPEDLRRLRHSFGKGVGHGARWRSSARR